MHKPSLLAGTLLGTMAIILGAFGAHYLKTMFTPDLLNSFETGVRYQFYHAFALVLLGLYAKLSGQSVAAIFWLLLIGTLFFSGSIYVLCLLKANGDVGLKGFGIITPIGGLLMIAGWFSWVWKVTKLSSQ